MVVEQLCDMLPQRGGPGYVVIVSRKKLELTSKQRHVNGCSRALKVSRGGARPIICTRRRNVEAVESSRSSQRFSSYL
jgi:hypothetical protein